MLEFEHEIRSQIIGTIAKNMAIAARTAPKARGNDNLLISILSGTDLYKLAGKMKELGEAKNQHFFIRDSKNITHCDSVVLIGTKFGHIGLDCGYCGWDTCAENKKNNDSSPCFFNAHDLGVAIGSAVSVAANARVDNRVMFSAGIAARELGYMKDAEIIFGIPLSAHGKNHFFDRT